MSIKRILRSDINDSRILEICNKIYFLHKAESEKADTYIEYQILSEVYSDYACDKNMSKSYKIQIDIFSKKDYEKLKEVIEEVLYEKDYRFSTSFDLYEQDTQLYHCVLRFNKKI